MALPLSPPIKPQLALTRKALPSGEEWAYEPKLDGFRAIIFVDGGEAYVQSRAGTGFRRSPFPLRLALRRHRQSMLLKRTIISPQHAH